MAASGDCGRPLLGECAGEDDVDVSDVDLEGHANPTITHSGSEVLDIGVLRSTDTIAEGWQPVW